MDSRREQIMKNIKVVLEQIKTDSGYENTIKNVQRFDDRGNNSTETPYIVILEDDDDARPEPDPNYTYNFPIMIDVFISQTAEDLLSTAERVNSILADVQKALMADHTRGGVAITTDLLGSSPFSKTQGQPNSGITQRIIVEYQCSRTDPTAAG